MSACLLRCPVVRCRAHIRYCRQERLLAFCQSCHGANTSYSTFPCTAGGPKTRAAVYVDLGLAPAPAVPVCPWAARRLGDAVLPSAVVHPLQSQTDDHSLAQSEGKQRKRQPRRWCLPRGGRKVTKRSKMHLKDTQHTKLKLLAVSRDTTSHEALSLAARPQPAPAEGL